MQDRADRADSAMPGGACRPANCLGSVAAAAALVAPAAGRSRGRGARPGWFHRCWEAGHDRGAGAAGWARSTSTGADQLPGALAAARRAQIPLYEVLDEEQLERLHEAAMRVLEELGIEFRDDEALALWQQAGAEVSGQRVRIPRELLMGLVAKAPERFTVPRPQPRAQRRARQRPHGVRLHLRLALRARIRRRAALRHDRRPAATCTSWPTWPRCCTTRAR